MKKIILPLALMTALLSTSSNADDSKIYGAGNGTCHQWTTEREIGRTTMGYQMSAWALGYISGITTVLEIMGQTNLTDISNNEAMLDWLNKECREKPQQTLYFATTGLAVTMGLRFDYK
jgi:hypothetical protein